MTIISTPHDGDYAGTADVLSGSSSLTGGPLWTVLELSAARPSAQAQATVDPDLTYAYLRGFATSGLLEGPF